MNRIGELFGISFSGATRAHDTRLEPDLTAIDWKAIRKRIQREVRGLVSKSIIESIYSDQPGVAYEDREVLLQAAANRLYANALYEISSAGKVPTFEPSAEIMQCIRDALEDSLSGWQLEGKSVESGDYTPPIEERRSTTDDILAALERASKNEVLQEAAKKRVQAEAAMMAAE